MCYVKEGPHKCRCANMRVCSSWSLNTGCIVQIWGWSQEDQAAMTHTHLMSSWMWEGEESETGFRLAGQSVGVSCVPESQLLFKPEKRTGAKWTVTDEKPEESTSGVSVNHFTPETGLQTNSLHWLHWCVFHSTFSTITEYSNLLPFLIRTDSFVNYCKREHRQVNVCLYFNHSTNKKKTDKTSLL